jgi:transcriptional regulator with XRE-family HTH domain
MDSRLADQFGDNLRRHRRRADFSQGDLAELIDIQRSEIGKLERGERLPRLDTILKLAAGVDASPCVLLAGLHWQPGYTVEGKFYVEDGSSWAAVADAGGANGS